MNPLPRSDLRLQVELNQALPTAPAHCGGTGPLTQIPGDRAVPGCRLCQHACFAAAISAGCFPSRCDGRVTKTRCALPTGQQCPLRLEAEPGPTVGHISNPP